MMGNWVIALMVAPLFVFSADNEEEPEPISPSYIVEQGETLMHSGRKVVVTFDVASIMVVPTTYPDGSSHQVLHLVPDNVDAKFTAPIAPELEEKLGRIGIADVAKHFKGKRVTLEGYVSGTALALLFSPTVWTFHLSLHSLDSIRAVDQKG